MNLNVSQTLTGFQFENKENLRNTAKKILNKQGATPESTQKILEQTIFFNDSTKNTQNTILLTSSQITLNNSLRESLNKLKKQNRNNKQKKEPILGELWASMDENSNIDYSNELFEYEIDSSLKNIFIAA